MSWQRSFSINSLLFLGLLLMTVNACEQSKSCSSKCSYYTKDGVTKLCLRGDDLFTMGFDYGTVLKQELNATLTTLTDYYQDFENANLDAMVAKAKVFMTRYSYAFTDFLKGVAVGSKLTFEQVIVLNGMETLG